MNKKRLEEIRDTYKETATSGFHWTTGLQHAIWKHVGELLAELEKARECDLCEHNAEYYLCQTHMNTCVIGERDMKAERDTWKKIANKLFHSWLTARKERDEARQVARQQLKRAEDAEKWTEYYKDKTEELLAKLLIANKSIAGWERAAIGHRERWQARTQDFIQARKERDQLLEACEAIQPPFYGMLLKKLGNPDKWPNNTHGEYVYKQLRTAIVAVKGKEYEGIFTSFQLHDHALSEDVIQKLYLDTCKAYRDEKENE